MPVDLSVYQKAQELFSSHFNICLTGIAYIGANLRSGQQVLRQQQCQVEAVVS